MNKLKSTFRKVGPEIRFYLSRTNNLFFLAYYKYLYRPKPNTISAFLDNYSKSKKGNFTVVQVGANDGINHDPISKFIKRDGWQGVLLEPQRYIHDHYLTKVYQKNKGINTLCAAIGPEDGKADLYKIGWCKMRWATGLASFQKSSLENAYSSGLVERASKKRSLTTPTDTSKHIVTEQVDVISPTSLLANYKISNISLLQIDTEGYDYEVIKIFDVEQTKPEAIIYENIHLSIADKESCKAYLQAQGYETIDFDANTLAVIH